ncbi:regulator of chromosome condensation (RCC1) repeat domain-containing protein [Hirsutella rhossiliensis]|uniref:Regulator of chromosome condensation (RCC1) repeat domain-containing protein n=1 Tax=Hirsutella rhossiliensis TaxID=111463 RepID=A0A9P8MYU1_9HYPO|nr:regulator of chromosome condensation (RCC1) repeat domain-containing protein [Hirsutella rhossiliensis]KAH0961602.1 regulator of chromosome condensation (RCC1) repeat domain-containing protein [Hirsutella rhossiliensis]
MSHLLWKYYWENDVDRFRRLLGPGGLGSHSASKSPATGTGGGYLGASPGGLAKSRRALVLASGYTRSKDGSSGLSRSEVNSRDHAGLTVLLRAASSIDPNACDFVQALIEHPSIDLYAQDPESGWNALHRSLYFGNISIARLLLAKERSDLTNPALQSIGKVGQLIKTKDHEGNSPFDVYNSTIATRALANSQELRRSDSGSDGSDTEDEATQVTASVSHSIKHSIEGGEFYVFGSNKNLSLGVGDEDDRQFPERILLQRPDELLYRFYESHLEDQALESPPSLPDLSSISTLLRNRPLVIQDVVMSKLHSALLTTDPVSNLYVCGVGRGGRLGLGHENTQFRFAPVLGPFADRKVRQVALGQNHSVAVAGNGELWTWGLNSDSQLGYALPPPARSDEEPMSVTPRQVFGTLKKEIIQGVAASAIHSVAHTGSSLYCWGRNLGQLALMDADSRSLDVQQTPRKVAASLLSAPIQMVSAIDKATVCLLSNNSVWVFANYGYNLVKFPVPDVFTNHSLVASSFLSRHDPGWKEIQYITSGGETIAAITARGDLFTMHVNNKVDTSPPAGSTTNPVKIKGAVTQPHCIWDSRKDGVTSVSVGEHGSVILCTESGAIWKRVKRVKGKAASFPTSQDIKKKDFKFERVPYITGCVNVRSSTFGAFAAVRRDKSVMSQEIGIAKQSLWEDVGSLLCLRAFKASEPTGDVKASLSREILRSVNLEQELLQYLQAYSFRHADIDMEVRSTTAPDISIPVHGWILAGRSSVLREAFSASRRRMTDTTLSDAFVVELIDGKRVLTLTGVEVLTMLNLVLYVYQDAIIPVWRYTRDAPADAYRFRQVRSEVMKMATRLHMPKLEAAARLQTGVGPSLDADMKDAVSDPTFFEDGDVTVQLDGADVTLHSQLLCQRCPFFKGLFQGRSQGQWLSQRRSESSALEQVSVDLKHIRLDTFQYVLRHLYADVGEGMFNDVAMPTIDDFSELVLDVMDAANELMLDRLSQACQSMVGKFATTRNIANLLNEISPCSVTEFKDAGLEYICLQLECMLENHLLDNLDQDLLQELDQVVRDNQLARFPIARGGRADLLLHNKYPDLVIDVNEERQRRVREMAFKLAQKDDDRRASSSQKMRGGSLDEGTIASPTPERSRRTSKQGRNEQSSPTLHTKRSQGDMVFNMDEEDFSGANSPFSPDMGDFEPHQDVDVGGVPRLPESWRGKGKEMSQKERKRQIQLQAEVEAGATAQVEKSKQAPWETVAPATRPSPWKAASPVPTEPHLFQRLTASPDTRFPGQGRMGNSAAAPSEPSARDQKKPLVPHSKSYMTPARKAEPSLGASMADIIGQQRRERELVKEAVAKRSLQEIQQEQAFQEWWDQESQRAQEEEARRLAKQDKGPPGNNRRDRKGRGSRSKGGEPSGASGDGEGSKGPGGGAGSRRGRSAKGKGSKA